MLKLGKNEYISNKEYHSDREYISSSGLKLAYKDMKEFYNQYIIGDMTNAPKGAQLDFGSLMHSLILEPDKGLDEFAFFDGRRQGLEWEIFKTNNPDKVIISTSQLEKAKMLHGKYLAATKAIGDQHVDFKDFFAGGEAEATYTALIDGIKVKCRTDYLKIDGIYDLKTNSTRELDKYTLEQICAKWDYDISAALYCDIVGTNDFYFVFLSTTTGDCEIVKASQNMLQRGREKYKKGIQNILQARETGVYFKEEDEIDLPSKNRIEELS